jgi:hypothetical protein
MKKLRLLSLAMVATYLTAGAQITPKSIDIYKTESAITVDAVDDEALWGTITPLDFPFTMQATMPDPSDLSAKLKLAWSDLGLLFFVKVTDDQHNFWSADKPNTYEYDNVEIFFYFGEEGKWGPGGEAGASGTHWSQLRVQLNTDEDTHVTGNHQGTWSNPPVGSASEGEMEAAAAISLNGWDAEVIFPWAMFDMLTPPGHNVKFGFEVIVADADETTRDYQVALMNDSKVDMAWNDKTLIGTAVLKIEGYVSAVNLENSKLRIYPTVTTDVVRISEASDLTLINTIGQVVLSKKQVNQIDLSGLNNGVYYLKVKNETVKIIKK